MIRKITLTHIILLICTIIVIVFGVIYFKDSYLASSLATKEFTFRSDTLLTLTKSQNTGYVYALELNVEGGTAQGVDIDLIEAGQLMQSIHFNAPTVKFNFQNDWYSDTCILLFRPTKEGLNTISLSYHFFTN